MVILKIYPFHSAPFPVPVCHWLFCCVRISCS